MRGIMQPLGQQHAGIAEHGVELFLGQTDGVTEIGLPFGCRPDIRPTEVRPAKVVFRGSRGKSEIVALAGAAR